MRALILVVVYVLIGCLVAYIGTRVFRLDDANDMDAFPLAMGSVFWPLGVPFMLVLMAMSAGCRANRLREAELKRREKEIRHAEELLRREGVLPSWHVLRDGHFPDTWRARSITAAGHQESRPYDSEEEAQAVCDEMNAKTQIRP